MKKIYIFAAVLALLTLSLNAQMTAKKKVVAQSTQPTEKVDAPFEGIKKVSSPAVKPAPNRATELVTLHLLDTTTYVAEVLPIYGYWHDASQHNQMIYPASMLTDMTGGKIKSIAFYPANYDSNNGINFYNGTVTFKLTEVNGTTGFAASNPSFITGTMTTVKTETMPTAANTSATSWLIEFDQDYEYNGGDLVIDVTNTTGGYGHTYFYVGTTATLNVARPGLLQYSSYAAQSLDFVPQISFIYEKDVEPKHDLAVALSAPSTAGAGSTVTLTATVTNNGDFDESGYTVTFTVNGTTIDTQNGGSLAQGASATFTTQYTTNANDGGQTVNFGANVACANDAVADNDNATASTSLFTLRPPVNVAATTDGNNATMTWDAPTIPSTHESYTWDFESQSQLNDWTLVSLDNDSYNWTYNTYVEGTSADVFEPHSGTGYIVSPSFVNNVGALNPDNWLISPEVTLGGTFTFWAKGTDDTYFAEHFGVFVYEGSYSGGATGFVQVGVERTATAGWVQYTFDLSQYSGRGRIAIRHYNCTDMYWLEVDDINYEVDASDPQPVSYNIYLDGQLVGNVDASTFTYTFNNVDGEHVSAVSAVYALGESEAVPVTFTTIPKTPTPTITYQVVGNNMVITATGQGTVNLSVTGGYSDSGEGTASVTIPLGLEEQTVTATATAQLPNYQESDPATQPITLPEAGRSPQPTITFTDNGDGSYTITVTGTGEVAVYIDDAEHAGAPIATADNSFSFNVEQHSQAMSITVSATNQEEGLAVSRPVTETYPIPAMTIGDDFQELVPQPANASTPIDMKSLMFVDRFSKVIPNENNHPRLYEYTLEETQVRQRSSNSIPVEVKHTGSDGLGFYSLNQIDNDTVRTLKMDVRNAATDIPLEADPKVYYYTVQRSTAAYPDQADRKWLGVLQRTSDGDYYENLTSAYDYGHEPYPGGQHHIHLDTDTIQGEYNQYLVYVPVVWTMGFDRVLYETDHIHNSYGAPKWKTGVGDVTLNTVDVELQDSPSATWNDGNDINMYIMTLDATGYMPTVNTMPYEPYMFRVFVESKNGKLRNWKWVPEDTVNQPHTGSHFEAAPGTTTGPICVWSEYVKDSVNVTFNGNEIYFVKDKVEQYDTTGHWTAPGLANILFAAEANMETTGEGDNERIIDDDLKIFVRFYYIVKGSADGHTPVVHGQRPRDGEGDAPAGYGSESPGTPPSPSTGVKEVQYYGDVVSTTYYNVQGMMSDKPFDGINIVVVRYSNGTTRAFKVVR